jgi:hypothetical protein
MSPLLKSGNTNTFFRKYWNKQLLLKALEQMTASEISYYFSDYDVIRIYNLITERGTQDVVGIHECLDFIVRLSNKDLLPWQKKIS